MGVCLTLGRLLREHLIHDQIAPDAGSADSATRVVGNVDIATPDGRSDRAFAMLASGTTVRQFLTVYYGSEWAAVEPHLRPAPDELDAAVDGSSIAPWSMAAEEARTLFKADDSDVAFVLARAVEWGSSYPANHLGADAQRFDMRGITLTAEQLSAIQSSVAVFDETLRLLASELVTRLDEALQESWQLQKFDRCPLVASISTPVAGLEPYLMHHAVLGGWHVTVRLYPGDCLDCDRLFEAIRRAKVDRAAAVEQILNKG
jgi:hypothetical protein